jgi:hypothetical protein
VNAQQAHIANLLRREAARARTHGFVDIATQTELLAEGYDLRALNKDLQLEETL